MSRYDRVLGRFLATRAGGWTVMRVLTPLDQRLMRWSNGRLSTGLGSGFAESAVLLRCTGARSGRPRDVPLLATPFGAGWVLVASATGQTANPAWYHNLRAHPDCALLLPGVGERRFRAREVDGQERAAAWQAATDRYRGYATYQGRTGRHIPVLVLDPA